MNRLSTHRFCPDSPRLRRRLWMFIAWLLLLVSSALHAQTTEPAEEPSEVPDAEAQLPEPEPVASWEARYNRLLAEASPEEAHWLGGPDDKILALVRPTEARITKGAVLMLHAAEDHPVWPPSLENLRRYLPRHGWATVAVALPPRESPAVPQRELPSPAADTEEPGNDGAGSTESVPAASSDAASEPEPAEEPTEPLPAVAPPPSRATIVTQRVAAAAAFLGEQGHQSIVLLTDNSSVIDSLSALPPAVELAGLVLINLHPHEPLTTPQLESLWSNAQLPILDIFIESRDRPQADIRQRHRAAALRNKAEDYYQARLLPLRPVDLDNPRSFWLERTRGFMEQHIKKQETPADQK